MLRGVSAWRTKVMRNSPGDEFQMFEDVVFEDI
jgi:hypothetical protein